MRIMERNRLRSYSTKVDLGCAEWSGKCFSDATKDRRDFSEATELICVTFGSKACEETEELVCVS